MELFDATERTELELVDENGGYTESGRLLSEQCGHVMRVSVYAGEDRQTLVESRVFDGPLSKQIDEVMGFLDRDDWRRVREALVAALVQRDYSFSAELIVNVFSDRIEFIGMGALKEMDGFTQWRNEKLLAALRRLRYSASRPDEFAGTRGAFLIVLRNEQQPGQKLLDYLKTNPSVSRKEAENILGLRQTAAGKVLKDLHSRGLIESVGGGKNIKYVLKTP